MLTVMKNAAKRGASATPPQTAKLSAKDLEFISANQRLEGFEGKITEAVVEHVPNIEEITESARRFGAQVPDEKHRNQQPIFKLPHRPAQR